MTAVGVAACVLLVNAAKVRIRRWLASKVSVAACGTCGAPCVGCHPPFPIALRGEAA